MRNSPLEGTGFEPSVPLFERGLSALPNGDAGPISWMGSLSTGRFRLRSAIDSAHYHVDLAGPGFDFKNDLRLPWAADALGR